MGYKCHISKESKNYALIVAKSLWRNSTAKQQDVMGYKSNCTAVQNAHVLLDTVQRITVGKNRIVFVSIVRSLIRKRGLQTTKMPEVPDSVLGSVMMPGALRINHARTVLKTGVDSALDIHERSKLNGVEKQLRRS
mgnify:CR=1 FL=1